MEKDLKLHLYTETLSSDAGGTPLIFLHGWGHSLESMRPLANLISNTSPKHLIDLPGFGKSSAPTAVWSSFDYAEEIKRYLDENHIDKACFIGHSFGGKVSLSFASRYPERVSKLILMASSGLKRKRTFKESARLKTIILSGKILKKIDKFFGLKTFTKYFVPRFGSKDYQMAAEMKSILVRSVNEDLTQTLSKITAPTLIIWGEKDSETPLESGRRFHKHIKNSQLISFSQHGHNLFLDVGAHLCASHISTFLKEEI